METRAGATGGCAPRTLVIGVAGGIGSGKSALAAAFERLGFEVVDADAEAKALLDREDVRARLESWWGQEILDAGGRVDRAAVARIVFDDLGARTRLEGLIHPLAVERCRVIVAEARQAGKVGVVIDAPLLFEAGLDEMCDAVVFVDAREDVREERVSRSRGWESGEILRREAAQMDLDEKKRRSRFIVENNSPDLSVLEGEADRIYAILRSEAGPVPE